MPLSWIASSVIPDVGTSHRSKFARTVGGAFPEARMLVFSRESTWEEEELGKRCVFSRDHDVFLRGGWPSL